MGFSLDFNDVFEGKVADGTYEVVINTVREDVTPSGAEHVQFDLIIRNDVNQKYKNAHIFHRVWKEKDTGKYNMKTFNTIGKACQLQNGKSYKSLEELLNDFVFKTAIVTVKNETSEHNGKTYENLNVKYWNPTKITGPLQHQFKKDDAAGKTFDELSKQFGREITDDMLPF